MAAAGIVVSVSVGAMKPVLEKLGALLGDKYKKLKGLRKEVSFLVDELSEMKSLLEKMDDAFDDLDSQDKKWRKDIINMSYDIEDCIDDFMDRIGEAGDKVGILKKASGFLRTVKDRYRIANQINEIKTRVIAVSKRRDRYKLNVCTSSSTAKVSIDPRLSALYKDSTTLVGIDTQKEDIVKWADEEEKRLKVMPIVGFGGLGKTTLANEVYHEVKGHFHSKAFVPVSQKPDVPMLLRSVCSKLGLSAPSSHACDVQALIDTLREYLHDKRYFIVLDDLWNVRDWNIISCAFPQNNQQSRLIVTTRIEGVAQACCIDHGHIHYMKPLSDVDSRNLFFRRIFGTENTCPPQFTAVSSGILRKCGGLPLAIVTMASTLVDQPKEHWDNIQHSILTESAANSLNDMIQILDLSYKHLPHYLRACFLYLGIYPEDYEIDRDELIGLWVAEHIVSKSPGQDVWDVAESYFNELVNRNMIQPPKSDYDGYTVHDMMLDLIIKRCREDNFVSIVHSAQVLVEQEHRVHRLSVSLSGVADDDSIFEVATNCCRSQVRTLVLLGGSKWMPPLLELKSLRVLYLGFSRRLEGMDLTCAGQLSQLRYLKIEAKERTSNLCIVLPSEIWRLRHLERLEIGSIPVCITRSDIVELPHLSHLILPWGTSLPNGIGKMASLRALRSFLIAEGSLENIKGLGKLNKLEELRLDCCGNNYKPRPRQTDSDTPIAIWMDALIFSLEKLSNLKSLWLTSRPIATGADALLLFSPPFQNLEHLNLGELMFSRVPRWITVLQKLRILCLGAKQMPQEDIDIIGTLPCLIDLMLWIPGIPTGRIVIGGTTGFNALEIFSLNCDVVSYLTFEDGAMPSLWNLKLVLDSGKWDKATPLGLHYLSSIKEITLVRVYNFREEAMSKVPLYKIFQEAADTHPSHPAFQRELGPPRPRVEEQ